MILLFTYLEEALLIIIIFLLPFFLGGLKIFPVYIFLALTLFLLYINQIKSLFSGRYRLLFSSYHLIFLLLILSASLSLFYTQNFWASKIFLGQILFYFLLNFLLFQREKERLEIIIWTYLFSTTLIVFYGLGLYILYGEPNYLPFSTFFNPNQLAGYLILNIPVALALFVISADLLKRQRLFFIILILTTLLFLTASRAAWISLVISLLVFGLLLRDKRLNYSSNKQKISTLCPPRPVCMATATGRHRQLYILTLLLLVIFLGLIITKPIIRERIADFFNISHRSHLFRILVWKTSLRIIKDNLLGCGIGTYETVYPLYKPGGVNTKMAHNTYLQMGCDLGLFGFFLFIFLNLYFLLHYKKIKKQEGESQILLIGLYSSSLTLLFHNLFDYTFYIAATGGLFMVTLAIFFRTIQDKIYLIDFSFHSKRGVCCHLSGKGKDLMFLNKNKKIIIAIFLTLIFIFLEIPIIKIVLGSWYLTKAEDLLEDKKTKLAQKFAQKGVRLQPDCAEYHNLLGIIYRSNQKFSLSVEELKKATALQKQNPFYHYELALSFLTLGDEESAIVELNRSIYLHKTYTSPLRILGNIYFKRGRINLARQQFEKIIRIEKNPYEHNKYQPIEGRERNPDFDYAHRILKMIREGEKGSKLYSKW